MGAQHESRASDEAKLAAFPQKHTCVKNLRTLTPIISLLEGVEFSKRFW